MAKTLAEQSHAVYEALSDKEKDVVGAFVSAGGCVMTWGQINNLDVSHSAIESLVTRRLLGPSVTADGMTETFVLAPDIFDAGLRKSRQTIAPTLPSSVPLTRGTSPAGQEPRLGSRSAHG